MKQLKERIERGKLAHDAYKYIVKVFKNYRQEIIENLEKSKEISLQQGMAVMLKKIEQDILRDISQAEDALKQMKHLKENNKNI